MQDSALSLIKRYSGGIDTVRYWRELEKVAREDQLEAPEGPRIVTDPLCRARVEKRVKKVCFVEVSRARRRATGEGGGLPGRQS